MSNNYCFKAGQAFIVAAALASMAGCSRNEKDTLSCHYEPVRGTVVKVSETQPAQVRFTPDSTAGQSWFQRFKVDKERLEVPLHLQHLKIQSGERYDAIVNVRTSGSCAPYVVYILY